MKITELEQINERAPLDIIFMSREKEVGRLYIKENSLWFEGEADKSAVIFFDYLKKYIRKYKG